MTKAIAMQPAELKALEKVLIKGDLSGLDPDQRVSYVNSLCKCLKISPLFQPFDFIMFDGKVQIYAKKSCTDQLRNNRKISVKVISREYHPDGISTVIVQVREPSGREDEAIGAVDIKGLTGKHKCNAIMRSETKAKRRATLSICGLGVLEELEVEDNLKQESREVNESVAVKIQDTIAATPGRPEFEKTELQAHPEQEAPAAMPEYILKAGKYAGKKISQLTEKQLKTWLAFYEKQVAAGTAIHPDITLDYTEIIHFTDQMKLNQAEQA